jgi:hypothetical protein
MGEWCAYVLASSLVSASQKATHECRGSSESSDETRGHSFVVADDEFRLVTLDDILVALPPRWWHRKPRS